MTVVLVTGGSGFVGLPVLEALIQAGGREVHALCARSNPPEVPGVSWHRVDLSDATATQALLRELRPESLVHLAWYVEHGRFWDAPENVVWVEYSLRLLRAFAANGGRRAVLLGTCAEYDWSTADGPLNEARSPIAPANLYGTAKDALRRVGAAYAEREGFELAWGRLFFLYGPREAPGRLVPSVIRSLLAGEPIDTTSGTQRRDFLHVDDVGRAIAALLGSPAVGAVNIASGTAVALADLLDLIAATVGVEGLVRRGAVPDRPNEPALLLADTARLYTEIGFRPQVDLAQGIADTVEWWRSSPPERQG